MPTRRRGPGEGSIFQRKSDGRWSSSYVVNGKRHVLYAKTRKEVTAKLQEAQRQIASGMHGPADRIKLKTFLEFWLEKVVKTRVRPTTYPGYELRARLHLIPHLGDITLQRLTAQRVVEWQDALLRSGVSGSTIRMAKTILSMALKQAMAWDIIPRNVASLVTPPSFTAREYPVPGDSEVRRLFAAAETPQEQVIVALGAIVGLRSAEARGLRWQDIDLARGLLEVRFSIPPGGSGVPVFAPLKTKASRRQIPLAPPVVNLLRAHHAAQLRQRMTSAGLWQDYDLVLTTDEGLTLSGFILLSRFHRLCKEAGLPNYRYHDLRHACASLLASQGVPVRDIMGMLGHDDPAITTKIYTHAYPEGKIKAATVLGTLLDEVG